MVSRIFQNPFQSFRTTNEVSVMPDQYQNLLRKEGYVTKKRKDAVSVEIDDQTVIFSLENVEDTFTPERFDQIVLFGVSDEDSNEIQMKVLRIEPSNKKEISGKVTSVAPGVYGIIDNNYLFYWKVLSDCDTDINQNDGVTADCVECRITDENQHAWRCLNVTRVHQPTGNLRTIIPNRETMDKNGIEITENVAVEFYATNEKKELKMMVKNTSSDEFTVMESLFIGNKADSQLVLISPTRKAQFLLGPGAEKEYIFEATSRRFGTANEAFVINFTGAKTGSFKISRFIKVDVNDAERRHRTIGTGRNVQTNVDYTRSVLARNRSSDISGPLPVRTPNFVANKFDKWPIPEILQDIALNSRSSRLATFDALATVCPHLNNVLTVENYCRVFHDLLHLEEIAMEHNIRKYDMRSYFTRENEYLALAVQNVGETRPSIIVGDYIIASDPWAKEGDKKLDQRGNIFEVKKNRILLKFNESFHEKYKNESYQITFHFSRKSLRTQHHTVELASERLPMILFPDEIQEINEQLDVQLKMETGELWLENSIVPWINQSLNMVQKQAVANILKGVARPVPYVIFGPPGTGKTVTVIEAILQIVKNMPDSRILVATPSNSAADLITERIISSGVLKPDQFMRLVSHNNVSKDLVPQTILSQCGTIDIAREGTTEDNYRVSKNGLQMNCSVGRLKSRRILIGTFITLGKLLQCSLPEDHFSHIVIDESGQSLETESIIPLTFVEKSVGQVILAGDPQQLGPIVLSQYAKKLGLARSFLVRLMERELYKPDLKSYEHRYDPRIVTRLVNNYRSIPSIMDVYSDMFYDGSLKAMINDINSDDVRVLKKLTRILPNNGVRSPTNGVVFIGVNGKNEKCSDSPSWYNIKEADSIADFFHKLVKMGQKASDIGIITPYTQQVKTIRTKLIRDDSETELKIGTVEAFQGQERKIILLSTVRTMERDLRDDERYSLGFIGHPNRLNVAISRARSLLVIFGCPKLLLLDENWKKLIEHCKRNESYVSACSDGY